MLPSQHTLAIIAEALDPGSEAPANRQVAEAIPGAAAGVSKQPGVSPNVQIVRSLRRYTVHAHNLHIPFTSVISLALCDLIACVLRFFAANSFVQ